MADFIVVGAGSAGAVIASRLSEDPAVDVLLLEAGEARIPKESVIPAAFSRLFQTDFDWNYSTEPERELANRKLYWPRGKLLGGSSAMNAMIWTRGARADFDSWAAQGNPGWSYADLAPHFAAAELDPGQAPTRIRPGIPVGPLRTVNPITTALLREATRQGLPPNDGFRDGMMDGSGLFSVSQFRGSRVSTAAGYLTPAAGRRNLVIESGALVERVILAGTRATGVRYRRREQTLAASGRVILAAGAIGSPQILLRSGIGPAADLTRAGIPVQLDLPGVGKNLQDHLSIAGMFHCRQPISMASAERIDHVLDYLIRRRGPLTSNIAEGGAFVRLDPSAPVPDLELIFAPTFFVDHGRRNPSGHGFTVAAILQHPASRGEVRLTNTGDVAIHANYLTEQPDLARLVEGMTLAKQIAQGPELDAYRGAEYLPGPGSQLESFIRERAETLYHPVGTCRMGPDGMAVVSDRLAVRGADDLWVADASIMPTITTGHPNAVVVAIGEKMGSMVRSA